MSQLGSILTNLNNNKKSVMLNQNGQVNKVLKYIGGDTIVYKNIFVENQNILDYYAHIHTTDTTLNLDSQNISIKGNLFLTGAQVSISGSLDMSCNSILDVEGITFCDNSFIGNSTTSTFDIKTNKVLTLQSGLNKDIEVKNRLYQQFGEGPTYDNLNGYLALEKDVKPALNPYSFGYKAVNTWTSRPISGTFGNLMNFYDVCWSSELGLFLAVPWQYNNGPTYSNYVISSTNGINWNPSILPSPAGVNWCGVCWSPEKNLFASVSFTGNNLSNRAMTSSDGTNWTLQSATGSWRKVIWVKELELFVAVGPSGAMTSPNGINWTIQTAPTIGYDWISVCWSPELKLLVAMSYIGENRIMVSSNGINWTSIMAPVQNSWFSVAWSSKRNIFVAVGGGDLQNKAMTSNDGYNWTIRNTRALAINCNNGVGNQIICNSTSNLLVGMSLLISSGPGIIPANTVITSIDSGTEFTTNNTIFGLINTTLYNDYDWRQITRSEELDLFVAVAQSSGAIMSSPDGTNWKINSLGPSGVSRDGYVGLCWSPELSLFVSVGYNLANPVMTSSLTGRIPTSFNLFDSPFNSIDSTGNWTIQSLVRGISTTGSTATPSVLGVNSLYISNSISTIITNLTNGTLNQPVTLIFGNTFTNVANNATIKLNNNLAFTATTNSSLTLLNISGNIWIETSRSLN